MLQVYLLLLSSSTVGWWQRRVVVSFFLPHHQKVIQGPTLAPSGWPLALGVFFQEKKSGNRRESALRITGEALKSILKVANVIWACVPFTVVQAYGLHVMLSGLGGHISLNPK